MNITMIMYGRSVGGAELQFLELLRHIAQNHSVTLLVFSGDDAIRHAGVPDNVQVRLYPFVSGKRGYPIQYLKAIAQNLRQPIDAIISTSYSGNFLAYGLKKLTGAPAWSLQTVSKTMRYPYVDRYVLRRFNGLIAGSSDIRDYLLGHGQDAERIHIINNWVDLSARTPIRPAAQVREDLGVAPGNTLIGCFGRFHHQKGQEFLIEAYRQIAAQRSDIRLALVGGGDKEGEFRELSADLTPPVIFPGILQGSAYNDILAALDIYVQPSRFEGLPRTLLDAMYLRRPVVATDVNGNVDAVNHDINGLLVPSEDPEALYNAILRLIEAPDFASGLGEQAHHDVISNFSMVNQLDRILALVKVSTE